VRDGICEQYTNDNDAYESKVLLCSEGYRKQQSRHPHPKASLCNSVGACAVARDVLSAVSMHVYDYNMPTTWIELGNLTNHMVRSVYGSAALVWALVYGAMYTENFSLRPLTLPGACIWQSQRPRKKQWLCSDPKYLGEKIPVALSLLFGKIYLTMN
jgi:hypothetical protein